MMKKRNRSNNYDWDLLQREYDTGLSIRHLADKYGMATRSFTMASKRGDFVTRSRSDAQHQKITNGYVFTHSVDTKNRLSKIMSLKMSNRKVESKRFVHNGIILESSWEKAVAESLDEATVAWTRPSPLIYRDGNQLRRYYPDFYLPDFNCYLDPKNDYVKKLDEKKLALVKEQNNIKLLVLGKNQLSWLIIQQLIGV